MANVDDKAIGDAMAIVTKAIQQQPSVVKNGYRIPADSELAAKMIRIFDYVRRLNG